MRHRRVDFAQNCDIKLTTSWHLQRLSTTQERRVPVVGDGVPVVTHRCVTADSP